MSASNPDYIPFSNHWLGVQSYYSVYLGLRSLFIAMDWSVSHEHAQNLRSISNLIDNRPQLFPEPWNILCCGNPSKNISYKNLPPGTLVNEISPLTSPLKVNFTDSYGKFLKTTRQKIIDRKCAVWKEQNKKSRVSTKYKSSVITNLHPTSLFDCLFRLRVRSNYEDADSFLLTAESGGSAQYFNESFRVIVWHTLFLIEMLIARHMSKAEFGKIVDSFAKHGSNEFSEQLIVKRWDIMSQLW